MHHPVRLFLDPDNDLYHASPNCAAIDRTRVMSLEIIETIAAPADRWNCQQCCPPDLYYPDRDVLRPPVTFHTDEECPALAEERRRNREVPATSIWWPSRDYERVVTTPAAWVACSRCIPSRIILYPLGSSERLRTAS
jgi:hypothetical protein